MTPRQTACLDIIVAYVAANGYAPTYRELQAALGLKSVHGVHRIVHGLVAHNKLCIRPNRHRSIEVIGMPRSPLPSSLSPDDFATRLIRAMSYEVNKARARGELGASVESMRPVILRVVEGAA